MPIPHPLPDPVVELVARRLRLIADPTRIRLLDRLRHTDQSVGELAGSLGTTQQNASRHLGALHQAGILSRRKQGNRVVYAIADESVFALCESVCGSLELHVARLAEILDPSEMAASPR